MALFLGCLAGAAGLDAECGVAWAASAAPASSPLEIDRLVLCDARTPWLAALSAPVVARLREHGELPLLVATSYPPGKSAEQLLQRLRPRRTLCLLSTSGALPDDSAREMVVVGADPAVASLRIAERFWQTSPEVVLAAADDPAAIILGASLAAQQAVPLLLHDPWRPATALRRSLAALEARRALVAVGESAGPPAWVRGLRQEIVLLDRRALQRRIVAALGARQVRTLVVTRTPDDELRVGNTAWLAPYVGLARQAPVVLCDSDSAAAAERRAAELIEGAHLRPRSITLLADYLSIGTHAVKTDPDAKESGHSQPAEAYELAVEPFLPTNFDRLVSYDVGRIPLASLEQASALFAAGLARPRLLAGQPASAVMVANPAGAESPLPLGETVTRATAAELKNCGVRLDEFYGAAPDAPPLLKAAARANLLVYQGHIEQEFLFHGPPPSADRSKPAPVAPGPRMNRSLDGLPVVVLQTCHSLAPEVFACIQELGGVAVLGTTTPVHSGSGSAFLKAVGDGLAYRGDTLGEAVRDARNYLFCVQELKQLRGHNGHAKTQRVALSFCLWGDPELRPFPQGIGPPAHAPVAARWKSPGRLSIALPAERLPTVGSGDFEVRLFPGSEVAGMVRQLRGTTTRRVTPLYFFRLPLPEGFDAAACRGLQRSDDAAPRAVVRSDPAGRFLYVVYLPQRERAGETFSLRCPGKDSP